jgi:sugar/nucleoside kinase (ribokinase family)
MQEQSTTHRPKTISIGGATFDLFVHTNSELMQICEVDGKRCEIRMPAGAKIQVEKIMERAGGGANNTSVGLRRLGCDAGFGGVIGSDQWGEFLVRNFKSEDVNLEASTMVEGETTSFSIIFSVPSGERIILYQAGTNTHLHDANFDSARIEKAEWIYLNHIQQQSMVIEDDLVKILDTQKMGFTWNPGGNQLKKGIKDPKNAHLLHHTRLLLVNKEEAEIFTGLKTIEDALEAFRHAGVVTPCITDGKRGSYTTDGAAIYHCPILPEAPVVDTTGAGDAFGTGMTWALINGLDLPNALRAGTINATSVVGAIGAQPGLLTDIEMRHKLKDTPLDVRVI